MPNTAGTKESSRLYVKQIPFEMKLDEGKRIVEGYASTFGNKDLVGDIVEKGAFAKTIQERFPANQIKVCWQHGEVIGKPVHMEEDSKGLYVQAKIAKTSLGNDALELVREGVVDRMSIGYNVIQDKYDSQTKTRYLKELRLKEFSLVTFPANEAALVTGVKTAQEFRDALLNVNRMDFSSLEKQGKEINESNIELMRDTIAALETIIAAFEPDDDGTDEPDDLDDLDDLEESAAGKAIHSNSKEKALDVYNTADLKALLSNFKF